MCVDQAIPGTTVPPGIDNGPGQARPGIATAMTFLTQDTTVISFSRSEVCNLSTAEVEVLAERRGRCGIGPVYWASPTSEELPCTIMENGRSTVHHLQADDPGRDCTVI